MWLGVQALLATAQPASLQRFWRVLLSDGAVAVSAKALALKYVLSWLLYGACVCVVGRVVGCVARRRHLETQARRHWAPLSHGACGQQLFRLCCFVVAALVLSFLLRRTGDESVPLGCWLLW